MRIIAGTAGRIAIKVPSAVARPTTDFVRQAIFSILSEKVINARVLDLYAGSGAIGLEALSRGAASCTFIDNHRQAISTINQNLEKAKLDRALVIKADTIPFLKRDTATYHLIFADPPYWKHHGYIDHLKELLLLPQIPHRLTPDGHLIAEISSSQKTPESPHLQLLDRREYGSSAILLFAPQPAA